MNPIMLGALKLLLPMLEKASLQEWQDLAMPMLQGVAAKLEAGKGKEEALILIDALDKLVKFEVSRSL